MINRGEVIAYSDLEALATLANTKLSPAVPFAFPPVDPLVAAPASLAGILTYGSGNYQAFTTLLVKVYAYQIEAGVKTYSATFAMGAAVTDGSGNPFKVKWTWTAAPGASGYVLKGSASVELTSAVEAVMLGRRYLGSGLTDIAVQGLTTPNGIVVMDSKDKMLASSRNLHVAMTRIADNPKLFVDSGTGLERAVGRNSGAKMSALEVYREQSGFNQKVKDEAAERWHKLMSSDMMKPENLRAFPENHRPPQRTDVPEKTKERSL